MLRGLDGLSGPLLSGTGFYIKRAALSGLEPPKFLGQTTREVPSLDLKDAQAVASCTYEQDTKWGTEVDTMNLIHSYNLQTVITSSSSDYYNWVLAILPYRLAFCMDRSWRISSLASTCIAGGGSQSIAVRQGRHLWALLQPILQTLWSKTRDIPLAC